MRENYAAASIKRKVGSLMRKKGYVKTLSLLLVTTLAAGTVLAGCGKKKVDYNMGDDGNGGGGGKLATRLNVPESYDGKLSDIDSETGLTDVSIKATEISVPDTDKMSIYKYDANSIDSDYKKRICESFYDVSAGIYEYNWDKPYKGDVEREIELAQSMADQATSDDDKSYFDSYIDSLKEELKNATEERVGAGEYTADAFVGTVGSNMYMISFNTGDSGSGGGFDIDYYPSDQMINYKPKEGAASVYCYSGEYYDGEDSANSAALSKEDASQKGIDFLASCGITDVVETDVTDLIWEYNDASYNIVAAEKNGYMVTYKRSIDGIAPYTPSVYGIDSLTSGDTWYDTVDETFQLSIDDNGIVQANCVDALKATKDKQDNVDLLSWDDILKKLPTAVNTYYKDNKTQYSTVEFNDVSLTYYKVKDGDGYKYTPVWAFAQCEKNDKGDLDKDYPIQLIMLDATNGELIDLKALLDTNSYMDNTISSTIDSVDGDGDMVIGSDDTGDMTLEGSTDDASDGGDSASDDDAVDISDLDVDLGDSVVTEESSEQ